MWTQVCVNTTLHQKYNIWYRSHILMLPPYQSTFIRRAPLPLDCLWRFYGNSHPPASSRCTFVFFPFTFPTDNIFYLWNIHAPVSLIWQGILRLAGLLIALLWNFSPSNRCTFVFCPFFTTDNIFLKYSFTCVSVKPHLNFYRTIIAYGAWKFSPSSLWQVHISLISLYFWYNSIVKIFTMLLPSKAQDQ